MCALGRTTKRHIPQGWIGMSDGWLHLLPFKTNIRLTRISVPISPQAPKRSSPPTAEASSPFSMTDSATSLSQALGTRHCISTTSPNRSILPSKYPYPTSHSLFPSPPPASSSQWLPGPCTSTTLRTWPLTLRPLASNLGSDGNRL